MFLSKIILPFLFFLSGYTFSQPQVEYLYKQDILAKFDHYSQDDGLSANKILDIYQDSYGFIWIATNDGLNRFDGYSFEIFKYNSKDSTSISDNHITAITEDTYGNFWIGTSNGLNRFNREEEAFTIVENISNHDNSLSHNNVREIYADSLGFLWIETLDGILNKFNIQEEKFSHYPHKPVKQPYYEYHSIYEDYDGALWIGGRSMGPYIFNKEKEEFHLFEAEPLNPDGKRENDAAVFFEDSHGNFWIGAIDGIYKFFKDESRFSKFYSTSTYDIIEDKNAQVWFATGNGVYRFKTTTSELIHYNSHPDNPFSLTSNRINCLFSDKTGNIWIGSDNGLNKYSPYKYKFPHYYHVPGNKNTITSNNVTSLLEDDNGWLWIGTDGSGLSKFNLYTGEMLHYKHKQDNPHSIASNYVSDIYKDKKGTIWLGHWRGVGFNRYNKQSDDFTLYSLDPYSKKQDWYNDFLEDSNGNFWIGVWGGEGMQQFNRNTGLFTSKNFNPKVERPIDQPITSVVFDGKSHLWLGSQEYGAIHRYDFVKERLSRFHQEKDNRNCKIVPVIEFLTLSTGEVIIAGKTSLGVYTPLTDVLICYELPESEEEIIDIDISKDEKTAWVLTNNGFYQFNLSSGLYRKQPFNIPGKEVNNFLLRDESIIVIIDNEIYTTKTGGDFWDDLSYVTKTENKINTLLFEEPSNLWIGTEKGLYCYDFSNEKFSSVTQRKNDSLNIIKDYINCFLKSHNKLWIGTVRGLYCYMPEHDSMLLYRAKSNRPNTLIDNNVLALGEDHEGNIWIGTQKGLCMREVRSGKFISYNEADAFSLTSRLTNVMFEDSKGSIWVGTSDKGLNRIPPGAEQIEHFTNKPYDSSSLSSNEITFVFEDSDNHIWIGTTNGLNKYIPASRSFYRYGIKDGFPNAYITSIIEDDSGYLWISTQGGLVRFSSEYDIVELYDKSDGLQSNRFSKASAKLTEGHIALGGTGGINIFNPSEITFNLVIPEIQITAFEKFDKLLCKDFTSRESIVLHYDENFFTIYFSSLDFTAPSKNKYKYKLEGVDRDWVYQTGINKASYTDIGPGEYIFKVAGTNNDNFWSKTPAVLKVIIQPPFYATVWFYIAVLLTSFLIVFTYLRLRIAGLKKEKYNIELEQKLLRSQMNPHFIFNSLTAIQNYVLDKEVNNANRYLAKFAKLLRLILDSSRSNYIPLSQELQTIENYLFLQKIRYGNKFEYFVDVDEQIDTENVKIPPMLTQPFIENAIEHGFQLLKNYGILRISFMQSSGKLKVRIEDNGIGIETARKLNRENNVPHESLATKITQERIQNINRFSRKKIRLKIIDLKNIDKNNSGTRVDIEFPLKEYS